MIALAKSGARLLTGLKVLDTPNFLAAPMCPMFLADFGAEVTQVEFPRSPATGLATGARPGTVLDFVVTSTSSATRTVCLFYLLLRSEPNYNHQQPTQQQEMQK